MELIISPHDDDNALFAAFTCMRQKPLIVVVADSYKQPQRGEAGCDAATRAKETLEAAKVLGCSVVRLGIRDDIINEYAIKERLQRFQGFERVYIPAIQGGSPHHDMVGRVAREVFGELCVEYTTYTRTDLWTEGNTEVVPTAEERSIKEAALACYVSQINLEATRPHFDAVAGRNEWLIT